MEVNGSYVLFMQAELLVLADWEARWVPEQI